MVNPPEPLLVVGLGEALFDCFPDRQLLGGAPINFAVHARALIAPIGGRAVAATRVGTDPLGERLVTELAGRGVDTHAIQRDPIRPTGQVDVSIVAAGEPRYAFLPDSAWDALSCDQGWRTLAAACDAVAFGTLAQRSDASRAAVRDFLAAAPDALRVLDVNLRQHFYSAETLEDSFHLANAVKLNQEELEVVTRELGADGPESLVKRYGLRWLVETRGAGGMVRQGAGGDRQECPPASFNPQPGADPVGAGDACCAGLVCGELLGLPAAEVLRLAARLGAYVAERPGATPSLREDLRLAPGH